MAKKYDDDDSGIQPLHSPYNLLALAVNLAAMELATDKLENVRHYLVALSKSTNQDCSSVLNLLDI